MWLTGKAGQVPDPLDFEEGTAEQDPLNISHKSQIVCSNQSIWDTSLKAFLFTGHAALRIHPTSANT